MNPWLARNLYLAKYLVLPSQKQHLGTRLHAITPT